MKIRDNWCFGDAILGALVDSNRPVNRPAQHDDLFETKNFDEINYQVNVEDIPALEEQLKINIHVFTHFDDEGRVRQPLYVSTKKHTQTIDLLYWEEHFAWIKNFSALIWEVSKKNTVHGCRASMGHFDNPNSLTTYDLYCRGIDDTGQIFVLPEKWRKVPFDNLCCMFIFLHTPNLFSSTLLFHHFTI